MEQNVGGIDRMARLVGGPLAALVGLGAVAGTIPGGALVGGALIVVGAILSVTGATQRCVLNRLLGVDTSGN
jgi:hypothetical protein